MLTRFIEQLFEHGRVQVCGPGAVIDKADQRACAERLGECELVHRREFPGVPPPFSDSCGLWAATMLYRAAQSAVYREVEEVAISHWLDVPCPNGEPAVQHYSVDLVFRFLPDLARLASAVSPADPLVKKLQHWANHWPLSSVGMSGAEPVSLAGIVDVPAMLAYYADRVIARRDVSRLAEPAVRDRVRVGLNIYKDEFPEFAAVLDSAETGPPRL